MSSRATQLEKGPSKIRIGDWSTCRSERAFKTPRHRFDPAQSLMHLHTAPGVASTDDKRASAVRTREHKTRISASVRAGGCRIGEMVVEDSRQHHCDHSTSHVRMVLPSSDDQGLPLVQVLRAMRPELHTSVELAVVALGRSNV